MAYPKALEELFQELAGKGNIALGIENLYGPWTEHPFGKGYLTTDGIQWGTAVGASATADYITVVSSTISPFSLTTATIQELEFGLTGAFKATSTGVTVYYRWEGKDKDNSTWTLLSTARTVLSTSYAERTMSGRFLPVANLNAVPFNLRLRIKSTTANKGLGKVKNSSYVIVKYKKSY